VSRLAGLGWRARIPLAEGMRQAVAAYRQECSSGALRVV
jgi:hypothetical protein